MDGSLRELWRVASSRSIATSTGDNESIEAWQTVIEAVERLSLFSSNEDADEISTASLRYILAPFRLAQHLLQCRDTDRRLMSLIRAQRLCHAFVQRCLSLELLPDSLCKKLKHCERENDDLNCLYRPRNRQDKIEMFQQRRSLKQQVAELDMSRRRRQQLRQAEQEDPEQQELDEDDEEERRYWMLQIEMGVRDALNEMHCTQQEIELLKMRPSQQQQQQQAQEKTSAEQHLGPMPPLPKVVKLNADHTVEHIKLWKSGEDRMLHRQRLHEQVFSDPNPYTMTLSEFAKVEVAAAEKRSEQQKLMAQQQLDAAEDEDNNDAVDRATMKAREWSNWKDDNERGIGNKGYL